MPAKSKAQQKAAGAALTMLLAAGEKVVEIGVVGKVGNDTRHRDPGTPDDRLASHDLRVSNNAVSVGCLHSRHFSRPPVRSGPA